MLKISGLGFTFKISSSDGNTTIIERHGNDWRTVPGTRVIWTAEEIAMFGDLIERRLWNNPER